MGQKYGTKAPRNEMKSFQPGGLPTNQPGPISGILGTDTRGTNTKATPPLSTNVPGQWDPNRGNPNIRRAAKLVVEAPKAPEPKKEEPVAGPTPAQIAAQQQAAAIAAQQAAFWANHEAAQRMKGR